MRWIERKAECEREKRIRGSERERERGGGGGGEGGERGKQERKRDIKREQGDRVDQQSNECVFVREKAEV